MGASGLAGLESVSIPSRLLATIISATRHPVKVRRWETQAVFFQSKPTPNFRFSTPAGS